MVDCLHGMEEAGGSSPPKSTGEKMVQAIIPLISKEFEKEMNNIRKQTNDATADKISKQIIDATMKLKKFAPDMTPLRVLETFKRNDLNS